LDQIDVEICHVQPIVESRRNVGINQHILLSLVFFRFDIMIGVALLVSCSYEHILLYQ
jgi:hypothetical protein